MKIKKYLLSILILILFITILFNTYSFKNSNPTQTTNIINKNFNIKKTPKTIVSLVPSITEILFALGDGDKVIGVDVNSNYPEEAKAIEKVGDFNGPDIEKITALKPDVVFAGNKLQQDAIAAMEGLGLCVIAAEARSFEQIAPTISIISGVMGKKAEGQKMMDGVNSTLDNISKQAAAVSKHPSIYYVMVFGEGGNWTSGPGSFINALFEKTGFVCATEGGGAEWMDYPVESLIQKDPDILILASDAGTAEDLKKDSVFKNLTAVKNDRVYVMNADIISRPGIRITKAAEELYGILLKNQ